MTCPTCVDSNIGEVMVVTSTTRPTGDDLYIGRIIYETDTGLFLVYTAAGWVEIPLMSTTDFARRNRLLNGGFDVWQRGAGPFATAGEVGPDMWAMTYTGTTLSLARSTFSTTSPITGYAPKYYATSTVVSAVAAGNRAILNPKIESVRSFAGSTVTISFWAKADAAKPISIEFTQNFGSGGAPSASVTGIGVTKIQLSTSWERYSVTTTIPSLSGKTVGTTDDGYLAVVFWFDAGSTYNARTDTLGHQSGVFDLWGVQVQAESLPSRFEMQPYAETLRDCQRYYQRVSPAASSRLLAPGMCISTTVTHSLFPLMVEMRAAPSLLEQTGTAAHYGVMSSAGAVVACSVVPALVSATPIAARVSGTVAAGLTAGNGTFLMTNNAAAYLGFSAEL